MPPSGQNGPISRDEKSRRRTRRFRQTFSEPAFHLAWQHYLRSSQGEAKDTCGIKAFCLNLERNAARLSHDVLTGAFSASLAAKFYKPKASGFQRTITIPRIEDALVFQAFADTAARSMPWSGDRFTNHVFSAVLHPAATMESSSALESEESPFFFESCLGHYDRFATTVRNHCDSGSFSHCLRADIHCYYDSIPHACLLEKLRQRHGFTRDMLTMFGKCLNKWSGTRRGPTPGVGIPQSVDASHFFANLYLQDIDEWLMSQGGAFCRYMDDIYVFSESNDAIQGILTELDLQLKALGLALNPRKTSVVNIFDDGGSVHMPGYYYDMPDYYWSGGYEETVELGVANDDFPLALPRFAKLDQEGEELVELATERINEIEARVAELNSFMAESLSPVNRNAQGSWQMLAFRFCEAAGLLHHYGRLPKQLSEDAAMGWCLLLQTYPWVAEQFTNTLSYYRASDATVRRLYQLLHEFRRLEYPRKHVIDILPSAMESDQIGVDWLLELLANESSWYVRRSIYSLLLKSSDHLDAPSVILVQARKESDPVLRRELGFLFAGGPSNREQRARNLELIGIL